MVDVSKEFIENLYMRKIKRKKRRKFLFAEMDQPVNIWLGEHVDISTTGLEEQNLGLILII